MNTKLTVRLDGNVIEKAKKYARTHNTSLSKMVGSFLGSITSKQEDNIEISPIVQSLIGVIKYDSIKDDRKDYRDYLEEKYK